MRALRYRFLYSPRAPRRVTRGLARALFTTYDVVTRAAAYAAAVTFTLYVVAGAVAQAAGR